MATRTFRAWLDYLAIAVPRHVRKMGYVRELRALRARRNRCREAWRSHLEHTREVVLEAAARCERRRSALVVNHLDWLCGFPGIACLATDLERLQLGDGGVVRREESLWGVTLPAGSRDWMWDQAPRPEMFFHLDVRHRVGGYASFPKRAWLDAREGNAEAAANATAVESAVR